MARGDDDRLVRLVEGVLYRRHLGGNGCLPGIEGQRLRPDGVVVTLRRRPAQRQRDGLVLLGGYASHRRNRHRRLAASLRDRTRAYRHRERQRVAVGDSDNHVRRLHRAVAPAARRVLKGHDVVLEVLVRRRADGYRLRLAPVSRREGETRRLYRQVGVRQRRRHPNHHVRRRLGRQSDGIAGASPLPEFQRRGLDLYCGSVVVLEGDCHDLHRKTTHVRVLNDRLALNDNALVSLRDVVLPRR